MPAVLQASMSSVPAGAVSFLPSTVKVTSAIVGPSVRCYARVRFPDYRNLNFQPFHYGVQDIGVEVFALGIKSMVVVVGSGMAMPSSAVSAT